MVMYREGHIVEYTIKVFIDCPQKAVLIRYAATAFTFVSVNGQLVSTWKKPYAPHIHDLQAAQPHLKCGENLIKVQVYNYKMESPVALIYQLSQSRVGCFKC